MAELTAVGTYVHYWWPGVPTWVSALVCFAGINAINLANVKAYGETEFWFAIIKVVAVIGMIVFGGYLLISGARRPAGVDHQPVEPRRLFPARLPRPLHDARGDHVFVRRAGADRHYGR